MNDQKRFPQIKTNNNGGATKAIQIIARKMMQIEWVAKGRKSTDEPIT